MPKINFVCSYCYHKFSSYVYSVELGYLEFEKCPSCKERIKEKDILKPNSNDKFGYNTDEKKKELTIEERDSFGYNDRKTKK